MERAGNLLGSIVRQLKQPSATFAWLLSAWPTVAGRALAAHARPVRCDGDSLEMEADGRAWQRQLEAMESEICRRVNQAWGGCLIRRVKFVVSRPRGVPREIDNEYKPFVRRG